MRKRIVRAVIAVLWTFVVVIFGLELILRTLDPLGIFHAYNDLVILHETMVSHPRRGYSLPPGEIQFTNWLATMTADQTRLVPDTNPEASCTIAMVGDSLTFGQGVEDDETFTNLLAMQYPNVYFINTGIIGYNIHNVLSTIRDIEADAYVYLLISNDAEPELQPEHHPRVKYALALYIFLAMKRLKPDTDDSPDEPAPDGVNIPYPDWVIADAETIIDMDNVLIVGFERGKLAQFVQTLDEDLVFIPSTNHINSQSDPHPNPEGHRELADSFAPYVADWIAKFCGQEAE
jgi:hypothetical protein